MEGRFTNLSMVDIRMKNTIEKTIKSTTKMIKEKEKEKEMKKDKGKDIEIEKEKEKETEK